MVPRTATQDGAVVRCGWARNELSIRYHDGEWGVPQHDDRKLFEFLILEGAQAGLSWDTILRKRELSRRFQPVRPRGDCQVRPQKGCGFDEQCRDYPKPA